MKHILTMIVFPLCAFALNPNSPVVRTSTDGDIVEQRQSIPDRYTRADGSVTVNYKAASDMWAQDGWKRAAITVQTNVTTTAIPSSIQQVASAYKSKMEEIYGAGAVTNRTLTRSYVAIDLSLNQAISADTGLRLATWFDILNEYWGKDEIWSYPWGQTSYSVTNITETWSAE